MFADPEYPGYKLGDRWFMKIVKGLVQGQEKEQFITSCRWMIKNCVTRMDAKGYPEAVPCEIQQVTAYGPADCPLFVDLERAGTQPALATTSQPNSATAAGSGFIIE